MNNSQSAIRGILFNLCFLIFNITYAIRYAGDFLKLGASARALGLGSAYVACVTDPSAIYYNPSAGVLSEARQLLFLHSENFAGAVRSNFLSVLVPQPNQQLLGAAILSNQIPDIKITELPNPNLPPSNSNRPDISQTVQASDWVLYFNYARTVANNFYLGGNFKFIYRELGIGYCLGTGIDLGAMTILPKKIKLGLRISDLTTSPLFWSSKTRELIMPRFAIGTSKEINMTNSGLLLTSELDGNSDKLILNTNLGVEYSYKKTIALRLGWHHQNFSVGFGLAYKKVFLDYAYLKEYENEDLGAIQKFSGGIQF